MLVTPLKRCVNETPSKWADWVAFIVLRFGDLG